jgi:DNA processing protein
MMKILASNKKVLGAEVARIVSREISDLKKKSGSCKKRLNNNSKHYKFTKAHYMTSQLLLHLSLIPGIGPATIKRLCESTFSEALFYQFSVGDFQEQFQLSPAIAQLVVHGLGDKKLLETELQLLEKHVIKLVTFIESDYPILLKTIHYPPPVLYIQGSLEPDIKSLAMVGSRKADNYGKRIIAKLIPDLVEGELAVVSGGAIGADTLVHQETLKNGGKTIAVIGSGLLRSYPASNRRLFEEIVEKGGAVISPFPLTMQALPGNFPARNRIIAGMSVGCVVVQAAAQSGALITARYALDEGRHVYAIPGHFDDPLSAGCHILLQQGATLVTAAQDILNSLTENGIAVKPAVLGQRVKIKSGISPKAERRESNPLVLLCQTPQSLDDLLDATQLDLAALSAQLFDLQLEGKLEQDFNGTWSRK